VALRSLAADIVAHADGCSRQDAAERVRRGAWTDDPVAAAYLADATEQPFRWRVRAWFRPRRTTVRRIDRTVAAIGERMEGGEY
jgi:ADP-ribosylglycohydrolase